MKPWRWLLLLVVALALFAAPQKRAGSAKNSCGSSRSVDLNSASKEELEALPGIGKAYMQKIINGRPYANKRQLISKGIVPQPVYDKMSDCVIARQKK